MTDVQTNPQPSGEGERHLHSGQLTGSLKETPVNDQLGTLTEQEVAQTQAPDYITSLAEPTAEVAPTPVAAPEKRKHPVRRALIIGGAAVAGVSLAAGSIFVGSNLMAKDSNDAGAPPTGPDGTSEVDTPKDSTDQLQAAIEKRPEPGSPEYQTIIDVIRVDASKYTTQEDVVKAYGEAFQKIVRMQFAEVPSTLYDDNLSLSIEAMVAKTNPDYWANIYSQAIFGVPSSEVTGDQVTALQAFKADQTEWMKSYILTAGDTHPTSVDPVAEQITISPQSNDTMIYAVYTVTYNPNPDNSVEPTQPQAYDIGGGLQLNPETNSWYWTTAYTEDLGNSY